MNYGSLILFSMETIHLPLKKQWYKMEESGEKKEEYREITPYWITRLCKSGNSLIETDRDGDYDYDRTLRNLEFVISHNGSDVLFKKYRFAEFSYGYTRRRMTFEVKYIRIGTGKPEWGAEPNKLYFVFELGKRIN